MSGETETAKARRLFVRVFNGPFPVPTPCPLRHSGKPGAVPSLDVLRDDEAAYNGADDLLYAARTDPVTGERYLVRYRPERVE